MILKEVFAKRSLCDIFRGSECGDGIGLLLGAEPDLLRWPFALSVFFCRRPSTENLCAQTLKYSTRICLPNGRFVTFFGVLNVEMGLGCCWVHSWIASGGPLLLPFFFVNRKYLLKSQTLLLSCFCSAFSDRFKPWQLQSIPLMVTIYPHVPTKCVASELGSAQDASRDSGSKNRSGWNRFDFASTKQSDISGVMDWSR